MSSYRSGLALAAVTVLAGLAVASFAPAVAENSTTVVDHGHVDLMSGVLVDGQLSMRFKDGSVEPPVLRDPETVVTHLKPEARLQIPDLPEYAFLGPAGSDIWVSPEVQDPNLVWAGWNSESLPATEITPGSVKWSLDAVGGTTPGTKAPGNVTVFQTGSFGAPLPRIFDTALPLPQTHQLDLGIHAHANWTFSAEGVYRLTFSLQATTTSGQPLKDTATYAIAVGAIDPTTVIPGEGNPPSSSTTTSTTTTTTVTTTTTTSTTSSTTSSTTTSTSTTPTPCAVLADGHVDLIAPALVDGALRTRVKDGTAGPDKAVWREPADTVIHVVPQARNTIPADPAFAFLGTSGQPVWLIPQTQIPGIVWAGWNTESLRPQDVSGDIAIKLTAVDGPGQVAVFLTGLPPTVLIHTGDGLPGTLSVAPGTHAHANWAFTREGIYKLTVEVAATRADGRSAVDTDVFTIAVGAVDPKSASGRQCTSPTPTTATTTGTTHTPPTITTSPRAAASGLASTGAGPLGLVVGTGMLLFTGGVVVLLLSRSRSRSES
ncbi:surface-anchored protein [Lentzea atacamensis]|uniref:Surface-anchored protein n=1 Tax=Lentzea atacamensis TaxID=531938 RepID=A0ABX9EB18_9PSEU|nr:choice-of-anchor M domain-containing protein [Lentzea atacamensis]RAS67354.1 surface-anchored protein [Lentzea atacamensis]